MSLLIPVLFAGLAAAPEAVVWPQGEAPRTPALLASAPLRVLLQRFDREPLSQLVIAHAGGEAGAGAAEGMRAALVALGLPSARMVLLPQPLNEPVLILSLETPPQ